ncbi:hypothetical protein BC830DRAFT_1175469 [Chytriomyces sp. MP71]|nr:hypothetical protein BC830DRAFT_1175469 [Chytriomyces sp. MP71]
MGIADDDRQTLQNTIRAIAPFSVIACLWVIISVLHAGKRANHVSHLQMYISISDSVMTCVWIAGTSLLRFPRICASVGYIYEFFANAASGWNLCVTVYCFVIALQGRKRADRWLPVFHIYSWGLPSVLVAGMGLAEAIQDKGDVVGDATTECWIGPIYVEYRIYFMHLFFWLHMGIIVSLYTFLAYRVKALQHELAEARVIVQIGPLLSHMSTNALTSAGTSSLSCSVPIASGIIQDERANCLGEEMEVFAMPLLKSTTKSQKRVSIATIDSVGKVSTNLAADKMNSRRESLTPRLVSITAETLNEVEDFAKSSQACESLKPQSNITPRGSTSSKPSAAPSDALRVVFKGILVATVFLISWTPSTIVRLMEMQRVDVPFWLYELMGVCYSLTGMLNALVFFTFLKKRET